MQKCQGHFDLHLCFSLLHTSMYVLYMMYVTVNCVGSKYR